MVRIIKKAEDRRQEIVEKAGTLFLTKGFERTTMMDVMNEVGVAKGTIYHYFTSKEDLLDGVIKHIAEEHYTIHHSIFLQTTGTGLERIKQLVLKGQQAIHNHQEHRDFLESLHQPSNAGMHIRLLATHINLQAPLYEELIRQGCDENIFITDFPRETSEFILAGIQFLIDSGIYPWSEEEITRRVNAFPSLVESMLKAPAGSFSFLKQIPANE